MPAAFDVNVTVTVELGFGSGPLAVSPTWTEVSTFVKAASWSRGRGSVQSEFPAGSGEILLDNSDGRFYPWNTSSPYSPNVKVGVPVRIRATHNAVTYPLFYGFAARWPMAFPTNTEELAVLEITETIGRLQSKQVEGPYPVQNTDDRLRWVLNEIQWPVALRTFDVGVASVTELSYETGGEKTSALKLMREATEAEQGELFQGSNGHIVFRNRVASGGASSSATFGPDGAELVYVDVTTVYDDDGLVNEARITGADGTEQVVVDTASATAFGPSTYSSSNDSILGPSEAFNVAEWIVAKNKDVRPRITGFVIDPAGTPASLWPEVLGRELRNIITVEASYPGSAVQLVQAVAVESITHSFEAGGVWTVAYGCHPLSAIEQASYWILGTSQLGTTTRLA